MEAQYKTSIWKNAIIPHMEAQYKTSIWKNAIIPHMEAQYKTSIWIVSIKLYQSIVFNKLSQRARVMMY